MQCNWAIEPTNRAHRGIKPSNNKNNTKLSRIRLMRGKPKYTRAHTLMTLSYPNLLHNFTEPNTQAATGTTMMRMMYELVFLSTYMPL